MASSRLMTAGTTRPCKPFFLDLSGRCAFAARSHNFAALKVKIGRSPRKGALKAYSSGMLVVAFFCNSAKYSERPGSSPARCRIRGSVGC
jgi:hypothetical protein